MATATPGSAGVDSWARWDASVVLADGESVLVRALRPHDAPALDAFHRRQSPESNYRRFFSAKPVLTPTELRHFTDVDMVGRAALCVEWHGEFIAWASYERWPGRDDADTAFMVDEAHQGKGIATLLLEHLAAIATSNGIERFTAEVLAENRAMLSVFARAGWPLQRTYESGVIEVDFPIASTHEYLDSLAEREHRADSRAMARLLLPRSIAVVGASDRPDTVGSVLWRNITRTANVPVHAVNPNRTTIRSADRDGVARTDPVWPTVASVPDDVWLAVVAVPAAALDTTLDDCIAAHVRGAVIVTAVDGVDSPDVDVDGLVARARRHGVRIIGPSSMGVATSHREIGLEAALVPVELSPGSIAIVMQSGSLGASLLRLAQRLDMGLSWFVSLGDRSDVSGNDLLQFWDDDDSTNVIAMYNETLGNTHRFARIARRVSLRRPIVAVRTGAAAIAPSGGALYQHSGLIEVPSVTAMLDTARVLATQPLLRGRRVAVVSNSRSPATLAAAALDVAGLQVAATPVALDWTATSDDYRTAITAALASDDVDGVLVIHAPPIHDAVGAPVDAIDEASGGGTKPLVAVLLGSVDGPIRRGSRVPAFSFPETAAAVLGRSYAYARWLDSEAPAAPAAHHDVDVDGVNVVLSAAAMRDRVRLDAEQTAFVLGAYGIAVPPTRLVVADDAVPAADAVGYPVAVKALHRHVGRSLQAGVALDLADAGSVAAAVAAMHQVLGEDAERVVVQSMTAPGLDLRVRVTVDPELGPLVAVGLGGRSADLLVDEARRLAPLSQQSAAALVAGSRAGTALDEAGLADRHLVDVVLRVAQLAADHHHIVAIDLNPAIVTVDGCVVTDAVVDVGPGEHVDVAPRAL